MQRQEAYRNFYSSQKKWRFAKMVDTAHPPDQYRTTNIGNNVDTVQN